MFEPAVIQPTPPERPWRSRWRRARANLRRSAPFVSGIVAAFLGMWLFGVIAPGPRPLTPADVRTGVQDVLASVTPPPAFSSVAYERARPSVVRIQTTIAPTGPSPSPSHEDAIGTGVIVDERGDILTSLHVVDDAASITVTFVDGSESPAQIVARQPEKDIAVLHPLTIPPNIPPATLGDPHGARIGDDAFVVGNPFGLAGSMTSGVISGLDRSFNPPTGGKPIDGLIQIDAAVNPGNSGGPLLDRDGRVIGIVSALYNPTNQDVFIGIGFAVPIDVAGGAAGLPPY